MINEMNIKAVKNVKGLTSFVIFYGGDHIIAERLDELETIVKNWAVASIERAHVKSK